MPRGLPFLLVVTGGAVVALAVTRVPEALAHVERFHVREVALEGNRYLDLDAAVAHVGVHPGLSIWDDLEPVAARLRAHPLVLEARVRRRLPSTLVLVVEEREPIGLLPTPVLTPVDREGRLLPIDPTRHSMDLPLLQARVQEGDGDELLSPTQLRTLAREVSRLEALEPGTAMSLSEAALDQWGDVTLRLGDPEVEIRYRPPLSPARLREGLQVLDDARDRAPDRAPRAVDLRFEDQVVVRYPPPTPR